MAEHLSTANVADVRPGASLNQIREIEQLLGCDLPSDYRELLLISNGLSAKNGRTVVYSTDELSERNKTYEAQVYAPGWLMVGDDSGGQAFLIDLSARDPRVLAVDMGSMVPSDGRAVASNLVEWVANGLPYARG